MQQPRAHTHRPPRPSPLAKVHFTRPISMDPSMGLVRDPKFWKRFSTAVHMTEVPTGTATEGGNSSLKSTSTFDVKEENSWLTQQRREKRKCRMLCMLITTAIIVVIVAAVVVLLWLTRWRK